MTDIKQHILETAGSVVNGARRKAYGTPEDNFARIALFWQAYFDATGRDIEITARDVSPLMRLMKEARLCESPDHLDSFVDIVGYALTGAEVNGVRVPDWNATAADVQDEDILAAASGSEPRLQVSTPNGDRGTPCILCGAEAEEWHGGAPFCHACAKHEPWKASLLAKITRELLRTADLKVGHYYQAAKNHLGGKIENGGKWKIVRRGSSSGEIDVYGTKVHYGAKHNGTRLVPDYLWREITRDEWASS